MSVIYSPALKVIKLSDDIKVSLLLQVRVDTTTPTTIIKMR